MTPFNKHLKFHEVEYFHICVHWNVTTLKSFLIWMNTLFEWILTLHIWLNTFPTCLVAIFWNGIDHFFSSNVWSMFMIQPMEQTFGEKDVLILLILGEKDLQVFYMTNWKQNLKWMFQQFIGLLHHTKTFCVFYNT